MKISLTKVYGAICIQVKVRSLESKVSQISCVPDNHDGDRDGDLGRFSFNVNENNGGQVVIQMSIVWAPDVLLPL